MEDELPIKKIFDTAVKKHLDGNIEEAETLYKKIIKTDPKNAAALNNLGIIFLNSNKNDEAKDLFEKAVKINPDYVDAINNLGICHLNLKMFEKAKNSFENVININPNLADTHNNLGNCYKDMGNYEKAISCYAESLKIKPDYTNALNNVTAILIQLRKVEKIETNEDFSNVYKKQSEPNKLLYLVYIMIEKFINLDIKGTEILLEKIKKLMSTEIFLKLGEQDTKFVNSYHKFLTSLLKIFLKENSFSKNLEHDKGNKTIYHIGESHCLSFAHQKIKINDAKYTIKPRIIFGTKAWHLGNYEENSFKSFFKYQINNIPEDSILFISFGEIDCRPYEGIIHHYKEKGGNLDAIIKNTVENYLMFTESVFKEKNIKRFYFGVPAPVINLDKSQNEKEINLIRINTVKKFNFYLESFLKKNRLKFIDIYKLTSAKNGTSNMIHLCDDNHLSPSSLKHFEKQISNSFIN